MEPNLATTPVSAMPVASAAATAAIPATCSVCHQPARPEYYFCPNCGNKLQQAPLSTTMMTQAWIYLLSIVLPLICFVMVTKWPGIKYFKSTDRKTKQIGQIAWILLILSTIITIWLAYVWTQAAIQSSVNSINVDMGGY